MCTVEFKEFDDNQEKYVKLAEKEIIQVINRGKILFTIDKKTLRKIKILHDLSTNYKPDYNLRKSEEQ